MIATFLRFRVNKFFLVAGLLALTWSCKPAPAPSAKETLQPTAQPAGCTPGSPRRVPTTGDLASFVRGLFPPGSVRVLDVRNDPPVPLPNAAPGTEAWLMNVRLTIAPPEDLFEPAPAQDSQALKTLSDDLNGLAEWNQAYARSPYTDLGPAFTVKVPAPAPPQLLVLVHAGGQALAPLYGKVAAEWQVDHWQFSLLNLPPPTNDESRPRGWFQGTTMIRGSHEASHYQEEAEAAVKEAKEHQAAIERRYQKVLAQATRPGTVYRGEMRLRSGGFRKNPAAAEVRFVEVSLGGPAPRQAQFSLKLAQPPGYDFAFRVKLADRLPLVLPERAREFPADVTSLGDMTISTTHATGKDDLGASMAGLLLQGMHGSLGGRDLPLFVHNRHFEGRLAGTTIGDLLISATQEP